MSSTMVLERGLFFGAAGDSAVAPSPAGLATGAPAPSWCVVPRCKLRFEKCKERLQDPLHCDDDVACAHSAEPVQGARRRTLFVLRDAERPDRLPMQPHLLHLQVRIHGRWLLHHLHAAATRRAARSCSLAARRSTAAASRAAAATSASTTRPAAAGRAKI